MKNKRLKIVGSNSARFDNAHHTGYHRALYDIVTAADKQKLHVTDEMLKEWKQCINLEEDISRETAASIYTQQLVEKDKERDTVLSFIFGTIDVNRHSAIKAMQDASKVLSLTLKPYRQIQKEGFTEETALVVGMLHDLDKHSAEVMQLGLNASIGQLSTMNTEYEKMLVQRRTSETASALPPSKVARPKTDEAWDAVADQIYASYLFAATDADRDFIAHLIADINKPSSDFKEIHNMTTAQRAAAKKKKGGKDGKKPSDPKKPDSGKKPDGGGGKKPDGGGGTPKPDREEDPGEDQM